MTSLSNDGRGIKVFEVIIFKFYYLKCCFSPKQCTANCSYIFPILLQKAMIFQIVFLLLKYFPPPRMPL